MPVTEPGRLQRVYRQHPVARRSQRRDPRAAVGLDRHDHLGGVGVLVGETLADLLSRPRMPVKQPHQELSVIVLD